MSDPNKEGYLRAVNQKSKLSDAHKALLDFDVPGWKRLGKDDIWLMNLAECVEFKNNTGRLPKSREIHWLAQQRLHSSQGVLKAERKALLDEMLPGWSRQIRKTFSEQLEECVEQANRLGRIPLPRENSWIARQKKEFKQGKLSADHIRQLDEKLPGWSNKVFKLFEDSLEECISQANRLGRIPNSAESIWLANKKSQYKRGVLSQDKIDKLDKALPGWSNAVRKSFSEYLEECVALANNLGRLPEKSESRWLYRKKLEYRRGELSEDNVRELDDRLPGWRDA